MVEALQFSEGGGFNITVWITAFYRDLTRIYTPEQDGDANPEIVCSRWVNKKGNLILENRQIRCFINKMLFQLQNGWKMSSNNKKYYLHGSKNTENLGQMC